MTINQLNYFIDSLQDKRPTFRKLLLDLQYQQQELLYCLEQEYLNLVRDRRTALLNYLKTNSGNNSKRQVAEGLKEMHARTQAEFEAFLKVKVYDGWQETQLFKQIQTLKDAGFPASLLNENNPKYLQRLMAYLLMNI